MKDGDHDHYVTMISCLHWFSHDAKSVEEVNRLSLHEFIVNHKVYTCLCLAAVLMLVLFKCFFSFSKGWPPISIAIIRHTHYIHIYIYTHVICIQI